MPPTLLLTRPMALSQAFLDACVVEARRPLPHLIAPLWEPEPTGAPIPAEGDLILTSGRAVEALAEGTLAGRRAWCVGARTAQLATAAGARAVSAGGDQRDLLALLRTDPPRTAVYAHGDHPRGGLAAEMRALGVALTEVTVYLTHDRDLTSEAQRLLAAGGPVVAPVFSPRGAARLAAACGGIGTRPAVVAISEAAAEAVGPGFRIDVAARPEAAAMRVAVLRRLGNL